MRKFWIGAGIVTVVAVLAAAVKVVQDSTDRDLWDDVLDGPL